MTTHTLSPKSESLLPTEFHQPVRSPWWRPLAELGTFAAIYLPALLIFVGGFIGLAWAMGLDESIASLEVMDHPFALIAGLGSLIIMIPVALIAARWGGKRAPGFLWSVAGRIRWNLMLPFLGSVLPIYVIFLAVNLRDADFSAFRFDTHVLLLMGIALALVPLQAAAEELIFRGMLPQIFGAWGAKPWVAYALAVPGFLVLHEYNFYGSVDIVIFAVGAAVLAHKTKGLEAAIVLHAVHNLTAFGLVFTGLVPMDLEPGVASMVWSTILTVVATVTLIRKYERITQTA